MKRYHSTYKVIHDGHGAGSRYFTGHMEEDSNGKWYAKEDIENLCFELRKKVCSHELCILEGFGPVPDMCSMCPIGIVLKELEDR